MNNALNSKITIQSLQGAYAKHGYTLFSGGSKDFNINIFGVRCAIQDTNTFNDIVGCAWEYNGTWQLKTYSATTDPGLYYFANPMSSKGTHIMVAGQYRGAYSVGRHQGKYPALVQTGPIDFYVDNDRDMVFDRTEIVKNQYIGANIHTTINKSIPDMDTAPLTDYPDVDSTLVKNWSAACQVFSNPRRFKEFLTIVNKSVALYGNKFTYTLFEESSL